MGLFYNISLLTEWKDFLKNVNNSCKNKVIPELH
jgi:hypothetical protein